MDPGIRKIAGAFFCAVTIMLFTGCADILFLDQLKEIAGLGSGTIFVTYEGTEIKKNGSLNVDGYIAAATFIDLFITIENRGIKELAIENIEMDFGSMEYNLISQPPPFIMPGTSEQLVISFSPERAGDRSLPVSIVSSDPDGDFSFDIAGRIYGWLSHANSTWIGLDVVTKGGYAYLADEQNGIAIFDVSDPSLPVRIKNVQIAETITNALAIYGNFLVVAGAKSGAPPTAVDLFSIWDISDLSNPQQAGKITSDNIPDLREVAISGHFAYATSTGPDFYRIDIQNVGFPNITGFYPGSSTYGAGVAISGDYAYIAYAGPPNELHVVDITDPNFNLIQAGFAGLSNTCKKLAISGTTAFVTIAPGGFIAVDISAPPGAFPSGPIGAFDGSGIAISYPHAFMGSSTPGGIHIIDVDTWGEVLYMPPSPIDSSETTGITKSGEYLFVSSVSGNLHVYLLPPGM